MSARPPDQGQPLPYAGERPDLLLHLLPDADSAERIATALVRRAPGRLRLPPARPVGSIAGNARSRAAAQVLLLAQDQCRGLPRPAGTPAPTASLRTPGAARGRSRVRACPIPAMAGRREPTGKRPNDRIHDPPAPLARRARPAACAARDLAVAQDFELPPVDEVFVLSAQATAPDRIEVRRRIAEGYYLYRHRTSVKADAAFTGATMALPKGDRPTPRRILRRRRNLPQGIASAPSPARPPAGASATTLTVKYQGCADAGVCDPPQTRTLRSRCRAKRALAASAVRRAGCVIMSSEIGSADHPNAEVKFALGDVVNTMIGCTNGETIWTLCHHTSPAAPLSLGFRVQGTEGLSIGRQQVDLSGGQEPTAAPLGACRGLVCEIRSPAMETLRPSGGRGRAWRMDWFVIHAFVRR